MLMINIMLYFLLTTSVIGLKSCIVLFTGGSNIMPTSIYTDFLSHLESCHKVIQLPYSHTKEMYRSNIQYLKEEYETITYLAHSSGATTAINKLDNSINSLILLDPVATPNIHYSRDLNFLESITIINADLSYKWSNMPPFIPFIPIFRLDPERLNVDKNIISSIDLYDYGHSDLIDNPYRDIMHFSKISRGNQDRKSSIYNYHRNLSNIITNIIY